MVSGIPTYSYVFSRLCARITENEPWIKNLLPFGELRRPSTPQHTCVEARLLKHSLGLIILAVILKIVALGFQWRSCFGHTTHFIDLSVHKPLISKSLLCLEGPDLDVSPESATVSFLVVLF